MQIERILAVALAALAALPASAATLDRIRETGTIRLGYLADARPFSFRNEAGGADGGGCTDTAHPAASILTDEILRA